ncbi:MAG: YfhO family protein [Chitinispirillales bacterium]|jgi:hypothetical protein|nr:YfhO family protein [Chitinispirillales bacterium]
MAKNKKLKQAKLKQNLPPPAPVTFFNARNSMLLSIAFLALLWFIQFYSVLAGSGHFWDDVVESDYAIRVFTRTAFLSGQFPHWTPYIFNGMPFFALMHPGVLYPFNTVLALLPVSDDALWRLFQACVALHFLIAGINMFIYMRYKRRSDTAALFGAIAFMFGGFIITHTIHTMMVYILAWFPLVLLLYERSVREIRFKYAAAGGLILGISMMAGHPQLSFYEIILLCVTGAFFLYRCGDMIVKRAAVMAVFFSVAAGLCLVQYLPTMEMSGLTPRADYTIADASESSLQFVQLITMLMPKIFGAYTGGSVGVPAFWLEDTFRHGYYNYWETCFYFGVSTLIFSLFWFRKVKNNRTVLFALTGILASFCIALGGNFFIYKMLFNLGIPGFTMFRIPARILFTWGILFPFFAAAALDGLSEFKSKKLKIVSLSICAAFALFGLITAAGGLTAFFPLMKAVDTRAQYASQQGIILLLNASLTGVVLVLFFKNVVSVRTAKLLIVVCLAIDMLSFASGQHIKQGGGGASAEFRKSGSAVETVKNLQGGELLRFNMRQFAVESGEKTGRQTSLMMMKRNQGLTDNIQTSEGYTALRLKHYLPALNAEKLNTVLDLLNVRYYVNPYLKKGASDVVLRNETYLPRAKLFYNAKVMGTDDSLVLAYMNSEAFDHHNEVVISSIRSSRFAKFSGQNGNGKVQITDYKFNRIELDIESDQEAILWLSEIWYPAWKAVINGEKTEVYRANYSFRAVIVPQGKSKVVFKFNSVYFNIGAWISLLTLIAALTYLILPPVLRRVRKS